MFKAYSLQNSAKNKKMVQLSLIIAVDEAPNPIFLQVTNCLPLRWLTNADHLKLQKEKSFNEAILNAI